MSHIVINSKDFIEDICMYNTGNLSMRGTKEKLIVLRGIEGRQWFGVIVEKISKSGIIPYLYGYTVY